MSVPPIDMVPSSNAPGMMKIQVCRAGDKFTRRDRPGCEDGQCFAIGIETQRVDLEQVIAIEIIGRIAIDIDARERCHFHFVVILHRRIIEQLHLEQITEQPGIELALKKGIEQIGNGTQFAADHLDTRSDEGGIDRLT